MEVNFLETLFMLTTLYSAKMHDLKHAKMMKY